jgi:uncharacterized membrane protein YcaP (DUF421 family)
MEIVVRATVMFFFILLLTRAMGKKELSQLTALELILLITIGDLVQQGVTQEDQSITGTMLAASTIGLLIVILSFVGFRWPFARRAVRGIPVVVVRNGLAIDEMLRVERLSLEDVLEGAREQGIADLGQVRLGVLEPDGKFSFIQFEQEGDKQPRPDDHRV